MCQQPSLDQEALDTLKFICERNHASHERRVNHELTVVIASLSFFALTSAAKLSDSFTTNSSKLFAPCVMLAFIALGIMATIYILTSARSNKLNLTEARDAKKYILDFLSKKGCEKFKDREHKPSPSEKRWIWEIAIIWGASILSGIIVFEDWIIRVVS